MSASDTVVAFILAIVRLCADDHDFVDAHGGVVSAGNLRAAWAGYFGFMPHYGIDLETIVSDGEQCGVFGWAWGGLNADNADVKSWRRPCAWRARVRDGRIRLWQVYVDTKAVFDLL